MYAEQCCNLQEVNPCGSHYRELASSHPVVISHVNFSQSASCQPVVPILVSLSICKLSSRSSHSRGILTLVILSICKKSIRGFLSRGTLSSWILGDHAVKTNIYHQCWMLVKVKLGHEQSEE